MTIDAAPTSAPEPTAATSVQDAAAILAARRAAAAPAPAPTAQLAKQADAPAETDNLEQDPVEAPEAPVEGDEPADETTEEQTTEATDEGDDSDFEVEAEGEKVKLSDLVDAWKRKNSFQRDYTQKTEAAAAERKAVESERTQLKSEIEAERAALQKQVAEAQALRDRHLSIVQSWEEGLAATDKQWEQVDWDRLAKEHPTEAPQLWMQYERHKEAKARVAKQAQELQEQRNAEIQQIRAKQAEAMQTHLKSKYPDLFDAAKSPALIQSLKETANAYGYNDEDMAGTLDPRAFDMWHDAMQWRQHQRELASAQPASAPKPDASGRIKIVKQATAPKSRPPSPAKAAQGRAQAQFNKTLTDVDAANLLRARRAAAQR